MQNYELTLESAVSKSFRCTKAANSVDLDVEKKATHHFKVQADIEKPYNVGLIVGASGSGKSTLAEHIWGEGCFQTLLKDDLPIIEQLPETLSYNECVSVLGGVGLTQVPCWIRPAYTLSNGQRARAEIALKMSHGGQDQIIVIDEWTSVVDRTIAKVMSHCVQKFARRSNAQVVLCSCHYDVIEWLNPDWVIDCNKQSYTDRRCLQRSYKRKEKLRFTVKQAERSTWKYFSRYHYLSEKLPGGLNLFFGLYAGNDQVGFSAMSNYVPHRKGRRRQMHSNRTVIHPDYCGFGISGPFLNLCAEITHRKGYEVRATFSAMPIKKMFDRSPRWESLGSKIIHKATGATSYDRISRGVKKARGKPGAVSGMRFDVPMHAYKYRPDARMDLGLDELSHSTLTAE